MAFQFIMVCCTGVQVGFVTQKKSNRLLDGDVPLVRRYLCSRCISNKVFNFPAQWSIQYIFVVINFWWFHSDEWSSHILSRNDAYCICHWKVWLWNNNAYNCLSFWWVQHTYLCCKKLNDKCAKQAECQVVSILQQKVYQVCGHGTTSNGNATHTGLTDANLLLLHGTTMVVLSLWGISMGLRSKMKPFVELLWNVAYWD